VEAWRYFRPVAAAQLSAGFNVTKAKCASASYHLNGETAASANGGI
jgi:hypothetical protein